MFAKTILALAPILFASVASAQSVGNVRGGVLVNHGSGFMATTGATTLGVGDSIMARAGGSATLNYADGCKVDVVPGSVMTVEDVSPCALVDVTDASAASASSTSNAFVIAGGIAAAAAVGVTAAVIVSNNDDDKPASP